MNMSTYLSIVNDFISDKNFIIILTKNTFDIKHIQMICAPQIHDETRCIMCKGIRIHENTMSC
jgi:hypothetical protein